jgi:hypothetical protein
VQQKITERMDDLVAERRWYREGTAIDRRARLRYARLRQQASVEDVGLELKLGMQVAD